MGLDVMTGVTVHDGLPIMTCEAEVLETRSMTNISMADEMARHGP